MKTAHFWGTDPQECQIVFPCDRHITRHDDAFFRGITIQANVHIIYRWICQLRVGTYSYGPESPQEQIPGMDEIQLGQEIMGIFELVDFEPYRQLTMRVKRGSVALKLFGEVAVSYLILPKSDERCRLLVKTLIRYPGIVGRISRHILPWGDLVMMRKQLLNFKKLAESTQRGD